MIFISPQGLPKINFYNFDPYHAVRDLADFVSLFQSVFQTKLYVVYSVSITNERKQKSKQKFVLISDLVLRNKR